MKFSTIELRGSTSTFMYSQLPPVEVIQSALEGVVPQGPHFRNGVRYSPSGKIESLVHATAGYGKVARLEQLTEEIGVPLDRVVCGGDGSSDIHVMLHVNAITDSPLQFRNRSMLPRSRSQR